MKRITLLLICLQVFCAASAADLRSAAAAGTKGQPPHTEFKYYGFYSVVDYTFVTNLTKTHGEYIDDFMLNGVTAIVGWQWRKESAVGIGFSYLNDATGAFSQIPVFVEFRSHFLRNRLTPFTAVQMGYTIPFGSSSTDEDYTRLDKGGITLGLEAGLRVALRPRLGLNIYVGYQMLQENSVERGIGNNAATRLPEQYHNLKAGIGVNF